MLINIFDRVKLAFRKDRDLAAALQKILGFYPHKIEFYRIALAHKSLAFRNAKGRPTNNERLEFLGDAIIEAVVSDIVFHRYPTKREGFLTCTRSKIVQRSSLNRLATEIGLNRLVKTAGLANTHNNNILGNAFEALVGAIYLDRGYGHCKWFIEKRIVGRLVDIDGVARKEVNFKSKLLEWTQKNRIECRYDFEEHEDTDANSPVFSSTIIIEGLKAGEGKGYSKKESQQAAARNALIHLNRDKAFADSIYRAKEKRTAMEADEVCALPKIEDIEAECVIKPATRTSRHAKPAPRRQTADRADKDRAKDSKDGKDSREAKAAGNTAKTAGRTADKGSRPARDGRATERNAERKKSTPQPTSPATDTATDPGKEGEKNERRRPRRRQKERKDTEMTVAQAEDSTMLPVPVVATSTEVSVLAVTETLPTPDTVTTPTTAEAPAKAADASGTPDETPVAERPRKPRRPRGRRPRPAVGEDEAASKASADDADREAIIARAEASAFEDGESQD